MEPVNTRTTSNLALPPTAPWRAGHRWTRAQLCREPPSARKLLSTQPEQTGSWPLGTSFAQPRTCTHQLPTTGLWAQGHEDPRQGMLPSAGTHRPPCCPAQPTPQLPALGCCQGGLRLGAAPTIPSVTALLLPHLFSCSAPNPWASLPTVPEGEGVQCDNHRDGELDGALQPWGPAHPWQSRPGP